MSMDAKGARAVVALSLCVSVLAVAPASREGLGVRLHSARERRDESDPVDIPISRSRLTVGYTLRLGYTPG
jgi:hypothetical protein